jgi:hypothetical protein
MSEQSEKEHYDKYEALCRKYGILWNDKSPRLVDETLKSITIKYEQDKSLNNVPLRNWDGLAIPLTTITGLSLSECVCMEKHAAIKMIEENKKEKP